MDSDVGCPEKVAKLNHSLGVCRLFVGWPIYFKQLLCEFNRMENIFFFIMQIFIDSQY